jgi:NAD(P)-dependent dehydrogenase (short-subunit alcohol dehydrogenase family)
MCSLNSGAVMAVQADVTDETELEAAFAKIGEGLGAPDEPHRLGLDFIFDQPLLDPLAPGLDGLRRVA